VSPCRAIRSAIGKHVVGTVRRRLVTTATTVGNLGALAVVDRRRVDGRGSGGPEVVKGALVRITCGALNRKHEIRSVGGAIRPEVEDGGRAPVFVRDVH
jgi:hypothetical protein